MKLILVVTILLLTAGIAAAIDLRGSSGLAILERLTNASNQTQNADQSDLWNWGSNPIGSILQNGSLIKRTNATNAGDQGAMETPSQAMAIENGAISNATPQVLKRWTYYDAKVYGKITDYTFDGTSFKLLNTA